MYTNQKKKIEKSRKLNWTKEEEYTLINKIDSAGEIFRRSGNSADINTEKRKRGKTWQPN